MQLDFKLLKNVLVVNVQGEIDMYNTDYLRSCIDNYLDQQPINRLVLNLEKVDFIDSSGLGIIIGRYKKMQARGGKVYIVGANPSVEKILVFAGINKIIPLYKNEQEITDI